MGYTELINRLKEKDKKALELIIQNYNHYVAAVGYSILKDCRILEKVDFPVETGLLLGFCVLLTFALATELPYKFTTWISSFPVRLPKSFSRSKKTAV